MLSRRVKYALKTLLYLADAKENTLSSAKQISENQTIPLKFLEQILRELRQHKILKSERGSEGGYSLLKSPDDIKIVDIIRIVDGPVAMLPCASVNFYEKCTDCPDEEVCKIRKLLMQVRETMIPVLEIKLSEMKKL